MIVGRQVNMIGMCIGKVYTSLAIEQSGPREHAYKLPCELKVFSSFQNFNFCDMHEANEYSSGDLKSINFKIWDNSILV